LLQLLFPMLYHSRVASFFDATPQNPLWISLWNSQKLFSTVLVPDGVGCSGCGGVVS
jgi:hypothetical protein